MNPSKKASTMFFEKNKRALQSGKQNHAILPLLEMVKVTDEIELYETPDGDYSMKYQGIFLHAPEGSIKEAKALCDRYCHPGKHATHLLVGLGIGYVLEEVFNRSPGHIIIFEPDQTLLRSLLENIDYSDFLESRVSLTTSFQELRTVIPANYVFGDTLDILVLPGYETLYKNYVTPLLTELKKSVIFNKVDQNTTERFNTIWNECFFENLVQFPHALFLNPLKSSFSKKPAVIISYGPSLDDALEPLKAIQNKVLTIAVGGALRPLLEAGITPDFAGFLDAENMQEQLNQLATGTESIRFLLSPFTQPCTYTTTSKRNYVAPLVADGRYIPWLKEVLEPNLLEIQASSSVSTLCFQAALFMGCDPIILVGQDLALRGTQIYAGGIQAHYNEETQELEIPVTETLGGLPYKPAQIKGQNGEVLPTAVNYMYIYEYLKSFAEDNLLQENPKTLINASVGGAFIEGFDHQSLETFIQNTPLPTLDKSVLDTIDDLLTADYTQNVTQKLHQGTLQLLEGIEAINQCAQAMIDTTRELLKMPQTNWPNHTGIVEQQQQKFNTTLNQYPPLCVSLFTETTLFRNKREATASATQKLQWAIEYYETCIQFLNNTRPLIQKASERLQQALPLSSKI